MKEARSRDMSGKVFPGSHIINWKIGMRKRGKNIPRNGGERRGGRGFRDHLPTRVITMNEFCICNDVVHVEYL